MREIKFRGWYSFVKKMVHFEKPTVGCDIQEKWAMMLYPKEGHVYLDACDVMQFTGKKDVNGRDIYEGDIIRTNNGEGVHLFTVQFDADYSGQCGTFVFESCERNVSSVHCEAGECGEVIGNIYENPELLKKKAA